QFLAARQVPEPHGPVSAAGEGTAAVGRESRAQDFAAMPAEGPQFLPRRHVPQAQVPVTTGGQNLVPVGREDRAPVPLALLPVFRFLEPAQVLALLEVPELEDGAVVRAPGASRDQGVAVVRGK